MHIHIPCVFNKAEGDGLLCVVTFWGVKWRREEVPDKRQLEQRWPQRELMNTATGAEKIRKRRQ